MDITFLGLRLLFWFVTVFSCIEMTHSHCMRPFYGETKLFLYRDHSSSQSLTAQFHGDPALLLRNGGVYHHSLDSSFFVNYLFFFVFVFQRFGFAVPFFVFCFWV
ncbi:uncharacterized protein BKA55DRAFT_312323 [Fusarium redolens]|uniref:Secreted protein n=1 Tax=Fusarium redolens TaxID=48865 RepID=A0A9P9HD61_FUSRE|nr:uncharacterized protein BKA55DRAFT_312323 [Fusarium redolens]KAH7255275.1 hypothetical protein BKA55DRAFT_312323 [Fusarium redolens]